MIDLGEDVVVHVDHAEHRLVMTSSGNDFIVHLDSVKHRLVMIDLKEDVVVHVDIIVWPLLTYILKDATASAGVCFKFYHDGFYLSLGITFPYL